MLMYIMGYLILFYSIYFLGHFCMSFAYGLGPSATTAVAVVLCAAVMITLWKASGCSEETREAVWGIFAGFFLWCFLGEFLEHERILSLVRPDAAVLLIPCILLIAYVIHRKLLPIGLRFALGHFGCVWLLHAILVNQADAMKNHDSILHSFSAPALSLAFLIIALLMLIKTVRARSKRSRLAFLLPSFIFFWATVETIQTMNLLPDYTCYAYWIGGKASGSQTCPTEETMDQHIAEMKKRYVWGDQQAENRAYTVIKGLPSPHFIDDFTARLDRELKSGKEKQLNEKLFYRIMEESFVTTTASAFEQMLSACVQQFKSADLPSRVTHLEYTACPGSTSSREDTDGKIAFIEERYNWDSFHTRELAGFLLKRFSIQFLTGDDFIKRLDEKLMQEQVDSLGEKLFCQTMKEHFSATCRTVFRSLLQSHIHKRNAAASPLPQ